MIKDNDKLKNELTSLKTKNEGLRVMGDQVAPLKKEIASLRSQNVELQKLKSNHLEKIEQLERSASYHKKVHEDIESEVKRLQQQQHLEHRTENQRLRADLNSIRSDYEQLIKLQMGQVNLAAQAKKGQNSTLETQEHMEEDSVSQSEVTTVIDVNVKTEIIRLKKQRELFLNTKVYNENDAIVKMIDEKIQCLSDRN